MPQVVAHPFRRGGSSIATSIRIPWQSSITTMAHVAVGLKRDQMVEFHVQRM